MPNSALPCTCAWCSARLWAGLGPASPPAANGRAGFPWQRSAGLLLRGLLFLVLWWLVVFAHGPAGSAPPPPARPPHGD